MGEEDRGGLLDPDPDLSKNRGGLPDPDLDPIFVEILSPSRYLAHIWPTLRLQNINLFKR